MQNQDGTIKSGLVTDESNKPPRQCSNCIWNSVGHHGHGYCSNPVVMSDPQLVMLQDEDGRIKVQPTWCSNGFQSKGNAAIYVLRHGETEANAEKKFRGWLNLDLDKNGLQQAKDARKYLQDKNIKQVFCSDLGRTVKTAQLAFPKIKATKDRALRPWDVGYFSGKSKDEYQEALNWFIDHPEKSIPDGESLKEFSDRQKKAFEKYLKIAKEDGPILLVAHSSNCIQFDKLSEGKDELGRPEDSEYVLPGGVMVILDQGSLGLKSEPVHRASNNAAMYGS
ncbi:MAG: hypothetical protein C5B59_08715 [Bacteroidetes bacterium]|nr:MAG: hypothetical protein C5B59_08715 [Bacteroidota bacterium]